MRWNRDPSTIKSSISPQHTVPLHITYTTVKYYNNICKDRLSVGTRIIVVSVFVIGTFITVGMRRIYGREGGRRGDTTGSGHRYRRNWLQVLMDSIFVVINRRRCSLGYQIEFIRQNDYMFYWEPRQTYHCAMR